jgi:hypothetical protein
MGGNQGADISLIGVKLRAFKAAPSANLTPAGRRNSLQLPLCKADLQRWAFGQLIWLQVESELLTLACEALLGDVGRTT